MPDYCQGQGSFLFCNLSRPMLEATEPHIQWIMVHLFLEVKWPVCEISNSPSSSADVKSECSCTCISAQHVCLNSVDKDDFILLVFNVFVTYS